VSGEGSVHDDSARGPAATVFVSDPTAEAERVAQALRAAGYAVVDVPQSMLVARVAVQHPRVVLVDADSEGALDVVARMRELPDAEDIHVVFVARPGGGVLTPEDALAHEGSGLFVRPVDVPALVSKVDALTGGAQGEDAARASTPPPSIASSQKKRSSSPPSLPPASMRGGAAGATPEARAPGPASRAVGPRPARSPSEPPPSANPSARRVIGLSPPVSPELQQLLAEAEQRVNVQAEHESLVPSPEDEIEAVLPAELLASLDEPLEEDEDDDELAAPPRASASSSVPRERPREAPASRTTGPVSAGPGTGSGDDARSARSQRIGEPEGTITPPPVQTHGGTHSGATGDGVPTTGDSLRRDAPGATSAPEAAGRSVTPSSGESLPPPTAWSGDRSVPSFEGRNDVLPAFSEDDPLFPVVLGPNDAMRVIASAIASRTTGSLCIAATEAERRIVLREGDVVTTASTWEEESLLAFLGVRGDLPRETVRRLGAKFPPFGRHAGAALVARGYLGQDQMWPTLRAHAEWLLARAMQAPSARLAVEPQPPGRLAGEPGVFGGATGAEVFVEIVRRIVPHAEAIERLGGVGSRIADGPEARLLGECSFGPVELDQIHSAKGRALREVLDDAPDTDLPTLLYALALLGVIEVLPAVGDGAEAPDAVDAAQVAAIDADAVRERVRARLQLVEDGDYFALLGVTRNATGYEVRRAFLELRRAFEPSRVLTPEVADLAGDVRKITEVLEEAYEILKDAARRERYRRAIEAVPGR
jgi:hypothetical protein